MSTIRSSTGLASGIDSGAIIDALINAERAGARRLESRLKNVQSSQAGVQQLQSNLLSITTVAQRLSLDSTYRSVSVQNSDSAQLTATSKTGAVAGTYQFRSLRLASNYQANSRGFANSGTQTVGSAGTLTIARGGFLDKPLNLDLLNGGQGVSRGQIRITDRSGAAAEIDLSTAANVQDVLKAINSNETIGVTAATSGGRLILTDTTGSTTSNLIVAEVGSGQTAAGLGIVGSVASSQLTGSDLLQVTTDFTLGLLDDGNALQLREGTDLQVQLQDGTLLAVDLSGASTLGDVIQKFTDASGNAGKLTASLSNGQLQLVDNTTGSSTFGVTNQAGASVLRGLGLEGAPVGNTLNGTKLVGGLSGPLLRNLRGGQGIGTQGQLALTDRTGTTATLDLTSASSLDEVVAAINAATSSGSVKLQISARIDDRGTGLIITDTSGSTTSNLIIADVGSATLAADLNIDVNGAQTSVSSGSLGLRYANEATLLSTYAPGGGKVANGSFRVTDSSGNLAIINIDNTVKSLGDVIDKINAASGINVTAKLNTSGDGLEIVDDAAGAGTLQVTEVGGNTASQLRLTRAATLGGDGKYRVSSRLATLVDVAATDTLTGLSTKLNSAQGNLRSAVTNSGASLNPFRLTVTATGTGSAGRLAIDDTGLNLGFSELSAAQDALLQIGANTSTAFLRTSSTNTFADVATGLDVSIKAVGTTNATVSLSSDTSNLKTALDSFVSSYNTLLTQGNELTKYDAATGTRGALQGSFTFQRITQRFDSLIRSRTGNADAPIRSLSDLGVKVGANGALSIDNEKFNAALTDFPAEVRSFFQATNTGFADRLETTLSQLNDSTDGILTVEINSFERTSTALSTRITQLDLQLATRRTFLERKFLASEQAISSIQSQQSAITALTRTASASNSSS